ncbi:MAG TPA: T9SS type A sorting domain-containing protein [Calditrichaeota bacterium]|nr:T9SS type A sorting domain-containing protein [Calditrichota bacterium]
MTSIKRILLPFLLAVPLLAGDYSLQAIENFIRSRSEVMNDTNRQTGCGFSHMLDLRQHWRELSPDLQLKAQQLLQSAGPARQKQTTSPGGHFIIHYDTSGYHAVPLKDEEGNGIPDYIDSAAVILENVWDVEINQLGFMPPPDKYGQPVSTYPVYFTKISDYGITWLVDEIQLDNRTIFTSYLELNTDYSGFYTKGLDGMRVTAAHEFNHAIQLGYNVWQTSNYDLVDRFFMEMTSTWLEDYVYPQINDYYHYLYFLFNYLNSFSFNTAFSLYPYANSLYLHMTSELYGPRFTVDVWERIIKEEGMQALETTLNNLGETFAESQNRYGVWLYFTGHRAVPGAYFPEAADYPMLETVKKRTSFTTMLPGYGLNLFEIDVTNNRLYHGGVSADSGKGQVNHICNGVPLNESVSFGKVQHLEYNTKMQKPVAVISNASDQKAESVRYNLQAVVIPPPINPVIVYEQEGIPVFKAVPQNSEIRIYDILGRLVQKLHNNSSNSTSWNLKSMSGKTVSSGLYLYFIDTGTQLIKGKFTVLR